MTLRTQTRHLLKSEANANDGEAKQSAAEALCDLYVILRSDPRYPNSPMLRGDAAQVRKRLMGISDRTEAKLKRAKVAKPDDLESRVETAIASTIASTISESSGSQGDDTGLVAAGGGAVADEGWPLVELIQRVIAPEFWQPQGGPGVIRYFAIKRVLVVRATSDVHEQVRALLTALR